MDDRKTLKNISRSNSRLGANEAPCKSLKLTNISRSPLILRQAGPPLQSRERGAGAAVRRALLADPARDPRLARHAAGARQLGGAQEQTTLLRRRGEFRNRERWEMSLFNQICPKFILPAAKPAQVKR